MHFINKNGYLTTTGVDEPCFLVMILLDNIPYCSTDGSMAKANQDTILVSGTGLFFKECPKNWIMA